MPKKIQKTLQDYLIKIKNPHSQIQSLSSPKKWALSGCKHPKTPSFAIYGVQSNNHNHNQKDDAATLADVDRFLFENFRSLYLTDDDETEQNRAKTEQNRVKTEENRAKQNKSEDEEEAPTLASFLFESPRFIDPPPDLCGSARFFVKPGNSGSLVEDALSLTTTSDEAGSGSLTTVNDSSSSSNSPHDSKGTASLPDNCVALLTYSRSPYEEFRRSMEEMVEARSRDNREGVAVVDWDFMQELLFCYLNLNEKKTHKFILSAFVDLVADMRRSSETAAAAPAKPRSVRTVRIGGEGRKKANGVMLGFGSS
ncbi:transcription repressor OFP14 [Lotus japonicus]|uniref:transcription repressor OFP14 n=1 Tax=Lotus japonicus TaxID=34305 RepID=UPI0025872A89|nr:transcription repressor OFP14 [Lotus japonicus]